MNETIKEKPRGMFGEIRGGTGGKGGGIIEGEVVEEMGKMRGREPRIITFTQMKIRWTLMQIMEMWWTLRRNWVRTHSEYLSCYLSLVFRSRQADLALSNLHLLQVR